TKRLPLEQSTRSGTESNVSKLSGCCWQSAAVGCGDDLDVEARHLHISLPVSWWVRCSLGHPTQMAGCSSRAIVVLDHHKAADAGLRDVKRIIGGTCEKLFGSRVSFAFSSGKLIKVGTNNRDGVPTGPSVCRSARRHRRGGTLPLPSSCCRGSRAAAY